MTEIIISCIASSLVFSGILYLYFKGIKLNTLYFSTLKNFIDLKFAFATMYIYHKYMKEVILEDLLKGKPCEEEVLSLIRDFESEIQRLKGNENENVECPTDSSL